MLGKLVEVSEHAAQRWRERVRDGEPVVAILALLATCTRVRACRDGQTFIAERHRDAGAPRLLIGPGKTKPLAVVSVMHGAL